MSSRQARLVRNQQKPQRMLKKKRRGSTAGPIIGPLPPGQDKMSEVLLEFIEPFREPALTLEVLEKLIAFGLIAWNLSLVSGKKRAAMLASARMKLPSEVKSSFEEILGTLIARKETYFADNKRFILSYDLSMTPQGPYLKVLSTLDMQGS